MASLINLSRRSFLTTSSGVAALSVGGAQAVMAAGHAGHGPSRARVFKIGSFTVATLLDGARTVPEPQSIFGMNVSPEEFNAVSTDNFLPHDRVRLFFTPTVVDTGSDVVLFDTGNGGDDGSLPEALADAGYSPDDITVVVITHMHPDHIGGLMTQGTPSFPNARYVTGAIEYNFWTGANAPERLAGMVAGSVVPLAERMTFLDEDGTVTGGITAIASFGHTPGHMAYRIESEGAQLVLTGDLASHSVWSVAYPDWEVRFDADKAAAAASRRAVLGMLAADRIPFVGYHLPFPGLGYVAQNGDGFRYVPVSYQFDL